MPTALAAGCKADYFVVAVRTGEQVRAEPRPQRHLLVDRSLGIGLARRRRSRRNTTLRPRGRSHGAPRVEGRKCPQRGPSMAAHGRPVGVARKCTSVHRRPQMHSRARVHTRTLVRARARTRTHAHASMHARTHTHTCTHARTRIRAHTHAHTRIRAHTQGYFGISLLLLEKGMPGLEARRMKTQGWSSSNTAYLRCSSALWGTLGPSGTESTESTSGT
jgi:hypothetical protein